MIETTQTVTWEGGSIFMYIIQGDMLDFSKLSTAWVFLKIEREGKETRERERKWCGGGGRIWVLVAVLKLKIKGKEEAV